MKLKEKILLIAIAIIFVFFVHYGIQTFYNEPKYDGYCNSTYYAKPYIEPITAANYSVCKAVIEAQRNKEVECNKQGGMMEYEYDEKGCSIPTNCNMCNKYYNDAQQKYNKIVFIIALIIGVVAMVVGALMLSIESVGSGIMAGGVLTMFYGTLRYWGDLPDIGRFLMLGFVLILLIWMGYKKLNSNNEESKVSKKSKQKKK